MIRKEDYIAGKIEKLIKEGKPQKQAAAIAYNMESNRKGKK
jgi:hypothetical protein